MDFEALNQALASLSINPDEIEDERYANALRVVTASLVLPLLSGAKKNESLQYPFSGLN